MGYLLENRTLNLRSTFDQAVSLDLAQKNSEAYYCFSFPNTHVGAAVVPDAINSANANDDIAMTSHASKIKCYICVKTFS